MAAGAGAGAADDAAAAGAAGVYTKAPGSTQAEAGAAPAFASLAAGLAALLVRAATLSCALHRRNASTFPPWAVFAAASAALAFASSLGAGNLPHADPASANAATHTKIGFILASACFRVERSMAQHCCPKLRCVGRARDLPSRPRTTARGALWPRSHPHSRSSYQQMHPQCPACPGRCGP